MSATAQTATTHVRRPYRALRFTRDEELVRLLRAGDERAFEAMYDRHHRGILAFCRHMVGSAEEAEDAVQHTFIAAHRDLVGTDKPIQLKAWLYTIARNRCLSILRARKEERALDDVPEPSVQGLAADVQQREDLRELLADLQRLPEDQRAALVLSELGALSHEEIGATLGVRKDKVKALVFQARESLSSSRSARDADCREIQEQLSVLRGGSLRRTTLLRHVEVCPACAAFKAEVKRQRGAMAAILPVIPSLALKESVLAAVFSGGAAGGGGIIGGGLLAAGGTKALVAKVATVAVVAGGATGGGLVAVDEISGDGEGNTATAMAGIPAEERSVKMVDSLRDRARQTAGVRAADNGGSATPAASPEDFPSSEPDVVAVAPPKTRRTRPAGRRKSIRTAGASEPQATRVSAPAPASVAAPAPEAESSPVPEAEKVKDKPSDKGGDDDGKSKRRRSRSGTKPDKDLKSKVDEVKSKVTGPGIDPQPDRGRDGERGHRVKPEGAKRKATREVKDRARRPKKGPPPAIVPEQAPQQPKPEADGRDDRERGRSRGGGDRDDAKKAYAAATAVADALQQDAGLLQP